MFFARSEDISGMEERSGNRCDHQNLGKNRRASKQYEACNEYQFDQPRDRYGNLTIRQYVECYPFNLNTELNSYKIKELNDSKKLAEMISQMKDGELPMVTALNEQGEELKMEARAMPRDGNINLYNLNGQVEKREQFLKESKAELWQRKHQKAGSAKNRKVREWPFNGQQLINNSYIHFLNPI